MIDLIFQDDNYFAVFPLMQVWMTPCGRLAYKNAFDNDLLSCGSLARDISSALEYLHGKSIVHRDVKPDNILFNSIDNIFVLSDFGSAIILPSGSDGSVAESPATVAFYPPEVCVVDAAPKYNGFAADLWALGLTVYCGIFKELPYTIHSDSYVELVDEIAKFVDPFPIIDHVTDTSMRIVLTTLLADRQYFKSDYS